MEKSLYERLGSTNGIGRIVDDVMAAHLRNPIIKTQFEAIEDFDHVTKMAVEFFVAGSDVLAILYSLKGEIIRV